MKTNNILLALVAGTLLQATVQSMDVNTDLHVVREDHLYYLKIVDSCYFFTFSTPCLGTIHLYYSKEGEPLTGVVQTSKDLKPEKLLDEQAAKPQVTSVYVNLKTKELFLFNKHGLRLDHNKLFWNATPLEYYIGEQTDVHTIDMVRDKPKKYKGIKYHDHVEDPIRDKETLKTLAQFFDMTTVSMVETYRPSYGGLSADLSAHFYEKEEMEEMVEEALYDYE